MNISEIALLLATITASCTTAYCNTKKKLNGKAAELIQEAEEEFQGVEKAGQQKKEMVVAGLYRLVPLAMRPFFPRQALEKLLTTAFFSIDQYAQLQQEKKGDEAITQLPEEKTMIITVRYEREGPICLKD